MFYPSYSPFNRQKVHLISTTIWSFSLMGPNTLWHLKLKKKKHETFTWKFKWLWNAIYKNVIINDVNPTVLGIAVNLMTLNKYYDIYPLINLRNWFEERAFGPRLLRIIMQIWHLPLSLPIHEVVAWRANLTSDRQSFWICLPKSKWSTLWLFLLPVNTYIIEVLPLNDIFSRLLPHISLW